MLGWHYRSKHEALIGFSNASFYNNELLTIPDKYFHQNTAEEIVVEQIENATRNTKFIYEKPISYHYIKMEFMHREVMKWRQHILRFWLNHYCWKIKA